MSKEKICFVIMPISDNPKYPDGHFGRVYEHLIKPACEIAGFKAIRADDVLNTNYIALDVIKKIVESELAICDLSSQNPNVLYELGIRQAFNKPVVLIKDNQTKRIFDIQGFRDFQYDENLRVDNVEKQIEALSETILTTYTSGTEEINSLISLLSISPASIDKKTEISTDTNLILNAIEGLNARISNVENKRIGMKTLSDIVQRKHEDQIKLNVVSSEHIGDQYTFEELMRLKKGDQVYYHRHGVGIVQKLVRTDNQLNSKILIDFPNVGLKTLLARLATLFKVL